MSEGIVRLRHFIDGAWLADDSVTEDRDPAHPEQIVAVAPAADRDQLHGAVVAARRALAGWARTPAPVRGEVLFRAAELLFQRAAAVGRELAREEGKTLAEGVGETRRAATILRYFAGQTTEPVGELFASATPGTQISVIRQPIGVVAAITPWNFPIAIPAWKIAPALAFGNTVVFKPATATPLVAARLVECLDEAGLPPGVLNLAYASGASVTKAWIASGAVDAVSFTGSAQAGDAIRAAAGPHHIKVQLELGGKNAVVVDESADLDRAAELIVRGAMASAGQKCTATSRVIVHRGVAAPFRAALTSASARIVVGDPLEPATTVGPVIDEASQARIAAFVEAACADGAQIIDSAATPSGGWYSPPTLLEGVNPSMPIWREEVFGPVVAVLEASDLSEAIRIHNDVSYGLSGAIFTRDVDVAARFVAGAQVGLVHVNGETAGAEPHVPFGGMKGSSSGSREQGKAAQEFFTQLKTVYVEGLTPSSLFEHDLASAVGEG